MILKGQEGSPTIRLYLRKTMQPPARTPSICDFRLCLNDGICDARVPDSGMRNTLSIRNKILSASECSVLFFFFSYHVHSHTAVCHCYESFLCIRFGVTVFSRTRPVTLENTNGIVCFYLNYNMASTTALPYTKTQFVFFLIASINL